MQRLGPIPASPAAGAEVPGRSAGSCCHLMAGARRARPDAGELPRALPARAIETPEIFNYTSRLNKVAFTPCLPCTKGTELE